MATLVCHTDGCPNAGIPIQYDATFTDDDGETRNVDLIVCGPCGQEITDVT